MISDFEKDIIENLKNDLGFEGPKITQEQFDMMVDYIINDMNDNYNKHELIWRLCGCYEGFNYNNVIDIFVSSSDSYYISELVFYVEGKIDQEYLVNKMIETNDIEFIKESLDFSFGLMEMYLEELHVKRLVEFCERNK